MGWNDVAAVTGHPLAGALPAVCYFAHSYVVAPAERAAWSPRPTWTAARSPAWSPPAAVAGAQFHPEKSGDGGRAILGSWLAWSADAA